MIQHPNKTLRERAETLFQTSRNDVSNMSSEELQTLVHEFQVHQIELEIQAEELREAQVELSDSRDRYADLYEFAPVGFVTLDSKGKIHEANLTASTILGLERQPLVQRHLADFIARDAQDAWFRHQQAVFSTDTRQTCELAMHKADGTALSVRLESISAGSPPNARCRVALIDLTVRKQAEESLVQSEERFRIIFEQAAVGVAELDSISGRILRVNSKYCNIVGYSDQELLQLDFIRLTHPDDLAEDLNAMNRLRSGSLREFTLEKRLLHKNGSPRWVSLSVSPMWPPGSSPTHHIAIISDITQRKEAEAQLSTLRHELAQVSRLGTLGELASGLAHELNQPLTALHLFANAALEFGSQFDSAELQKSLKRTCDQSLRAGEIVRRMLSYAKRDSSHRVTADVNQLAREVLPLLDHALQHNGIQLEMELQENLPAVQVDPIQIQQVLVNLIRNGIDAMTSTENSQRQLVVRTEWNGNEVQISVTDTGTGLDGEIAENLFHPFQTTKPKGLGLGLPICRTLVEAHGGKIRAISNPVGGTTFVFTLPAFAEEQHS